MTRTEELAEASRAALQRAKDITRLEGELLEYLMRRMWGEWTLERDVARDAIEVKHERRFVMWIEVDHLMREGAEAMSARLIAAVKQRERARKERKAG